MSSSSKRPMREPTLDFGTVVSLSTFSWLAARRPLRSLSSTGRRNAVERKIGLASRSQWN